MEILLSEAAAIYNLIQSFANQRLPVRTAFKFNKIALEVEPHEKFYKIKTAEIIQEYGEKDAEGKLIMTENNTGYKIQKGKEEECFLKVNELAELPIELSEIITFSLEEIEEVGEINLQDMYLLNKFIKE